MFLNDSMTVWKEEDGDSNLENTAFRSSSPRLLPVLHHLKASMGGYATMWELKISGGLLKANHLKSIGIQVTHLIESMGYSFRHPKYRMLTIT